MDAIARVRAEAIEAIKLPSHYGATYDTRGNLTAFTGSGETLTYDDANRQIKDVTSGVTWQYLFGGADERAVRVPAANSGLPVPRREIARFIVQGKGWAQGSNCSEGSLTFGDVHCTDPDWGYIQTVSAQGLTVGCGGGSYCPDAAVTRSTAAVLFMKAEHGSTYNPGCAGIFSDLPCTDGTAKYAEAAYNEAAMAACGTSPLRFCPTNSLTELDAAKADNKLWPSYKPISGGSLYTLRNTENQLVTEFADSMPSRDNVYLGNIVVASYLDKQPGGSGSWQFHASDHLGTVRLTVDGATIGTTLLESDKYWPYGDRQTPANVPAQRVAFAAMERDLENNHFYDHARHHDFNLGRFISADKIGGHPDEPQSLNRYSYGGNNPMKYTDPNGKEKFVFLYTNYIAAPSVKPSFFGIPLGPTLKGDNRNFRSFPDRFRTQQRVVVETDPTKGPALVSADGKVQASTKVFTGEVVAPGKSSFSVSDPARDSNGLSFQMSGSAKTGATAAPSIDYSFSISISPSGIVSVRGTEEGFPSTLGTVTNESGQTVTFANYSEDSAPGSSLGNGALSLFDFLGDHAVNQQCQFGLQPGCRSGS